MPFMRPRSEAARLERHRSIYGAETLPPEVRRRLGPSMSTFSEVVWAWMPSPLFGPDGKFQLPLPRWLTVKMRGAGRRLG